MTLWRAIAYFLREAVLNVLRGWRVSVLAVLTIAVSLFVGGTFLLISGNMARVVATWREEARLVVYLHAAPTPEALQAVRDAIGRAPWVRQVREIDAAEAKQRFRALFPSMADLVEGWSEDPLPPSFEVAFDATRAEPAAFASWVAALRALPGVAMVDDDRDWLRQLETAIAIVRGVGLALGAVLLGAAVFTIGSVIRLTAYLYAEEIAILRLVGGTEFFIRGPFYAEGLLEGLLGSGLAVGGLFVAHALLRPRAGESLVAWMLAGGFLPWQQIGGLLALGGAAGLIGAILSLRRENLGATAPEN